MASLDGDERVMVFDFDFTNVFFFQVPFLAEETDDVHFVDLVFFPFANVEGGPEWFCRGGVFTDGVVGFRDFG